MKIKNPFWIVTYLDKWLSDCHFKLLALSNGVYTSVRHRVVGSEKVERFSVAFFYGPSMDAVIESYVTLPLYWKFNFGEYKEQIVKDF